MHKTIIINSVNVELLHKLTENKLIYFPTNLKKDALYMLN